MISQEQVLALAPDASSIKAGEGLASARKWLSVGRDARAVWGLLQGSGKQPYQARVALSDLSSSCSCPSRKFPCKHGIGLMLLLARQPDAVAEASAPDFVEEWLSKRAEKVARKTEATEARAAEPTDPEAAAAAARKREAARNKRTGEGLAELRAWMRDLAAEGMGSQDLRLPTTWEQRARRLNDAQLPGLARQVADLGSLVASRADWLEQVVLGFGRIHLSLAAHERLETLDADERLDLERHFGAVQREFDISAEARVNDEWFCFGEHSEQQERLSLRRSWLRGRESGRDALLLQFAVGNQPLPAAPAPGSTHSLTLGFFPGKAPLRAAILGGDVAAARAASPPAAQERIATALSAIAARLALDPWTTHFPLHLRARLGRDEAGAWWLADESGDALPLLSRRSMYEWQALAAGAVSDWFGEWDGARLRLLGWWPAC